MIHLTIGIVTYNGRDLLRQCLESIGASGVRCSSEIVVVDNGSADGTVAWLAQACPGVRVLANEGNLGVAAGNNQCLHAASGRYLLLLNNDTLVLPGMLDRLVAFADAHQDAGAVGGKLVNADGSFQFSHVAFPTLGSEFIHATGLWRLYNPRYPSRGDASAPSEVDWMPSACLLVRTAAALAVGGVDESFFMYSDETDLQYCLHRAGWKVYYLPDVRTIHLGGRSASPWRRRKLIYRGKLLFFRKHYGPLRTGALRLMFLISSGLKAGLWGLAHALPSLRGRARDELRSHLEVARLCLKLR